MELNSNVLLVNKSQDRAERMKNHILNMTSKINVHTIDSRAQLAGVMSKNEIKCLLVCDDIGKTDLFFILRYFTVMKEKNNNVEIPIFLSSDDFDLVQEAVTKFPLKKLMVLHSPLDMNDVVAKIKIAAGSTSKPATKKFTKEIAPKSKSSKNELDIDLEFINVFISNTKKVISQMADVAELKSSPPILMAQLQGPLDIDISAKILISSSYFKGSYYIAFPKQTFLNFYEKVVMEKCTEINDENKDFASELANIIYGQCKKKFSDEGLNLEMVIPTLHLGAIHNSVVVIIPFESPLGKFYLSVAPGLI